MTAILLFRILSRMISVLGGPQLIHSEIGATAADSMRWTFGRGATVGIAPGWCPLQRLKESGVSVSARAGSAETRKRRSEEAGSGAAGGSAEWTDSLWYHLWYQFLWYQCRYCFDPISNDVLPLDFDYFLAIAGFDIDLSNGQQFINRCVWIRPCFVFCMYRRQSMISLLISMCAHVWYHTQRKCYDIMIWCYYIMYKIILY